jgi:cellulose synthase/poly-beta-1,6-N-acetylglucosamine synthase-like glycosyltransferase
MEVVVVDGNSKDSTVRICSEFSKRYPDNFKIITEKESNGKPAALNLALRHTTGDIIGVFDADSLPEKQTLQKVAFYFTDPQVKALQGRTTSLNEKRNILTRVAAMEEKVWFQTSLVGKENLRLFVPLTGSCQFVRREVLEELGGWDENSLTEDVELALRLVEKEYQIKYVPDVCSGQETPNGLKDLFKQRVRWYRGYMETAIKYGRLLKHLNRKTLDAEISLASPFLMVLSLLSYINWFYVAFFVSRNSLSINFTGLVIVLTAVSLFSIGAALAAFEKPVTARNLLWIPSIYIYWFIQIWFAGWAFVKLVFRRKRVWNKTVKKGFTDPALPWVSEF